MENKPEIAIIGTGRMSSGMANNFLKAGCSVDVWNRTPDKVQKFIEQGAVMASTPKEAAERAKIVFEVTANDESSQAVWMGENGIMAGAHQDSILIASSTLSAKWVDELASICAQEGRTFCDMALTGGKKGAEDATLTFLAGGEPLVVAELAPFLMSTVGKEVIYFGPAGSGMRFKLILNAIKAAHLVVLREGLSLLDEKIYRENAIVALAKLVGDMTQRAVQDRGNKVGSETNFRLDLAAKDVRYACELTGNTPTPTLDAAKQEYRRQVMAGYGLEEWTKVVWNMV